MKYYINNKNEIFAYQSDAEMQQFAKEPLTEITDEQLAELQAPTAEQLSEQAKSKAQQYLNSTDWIVTKIAEIQLAGGDVEALKVKYATELTERKLMRELI